MSRSQKVQYSEGQVVKIDKDVRARVAVENIDMLTKIIEAYEHLGIVSTVDGGAGEVIIRGTLDTRSEIMVILQKMPFPVEIIEDDRV